MNTSSSPEPPESTAVDGIPDFFVEIALAVEVALLLLVPIAFYADLSPLIEFEVNGLDYRLQASRWVAVATGGLGALITLGLAVLARHPSRYFFPVSLNSSNYQRQYRLAARLIRIIALLEAGLMIYCLQVIIAGGMKEVSALFHPWVPGMIMGAMIIVVLTYYRLARRGE